MNTVEWVIGFAGVAVTVIATVIWFGVRHRRRTVVEPEVNPGLIQAETASDISPALIGPLIEGRAAVRDIALALLDLAVRGYITLQPLTKDEGSWLIMRTNKPARGLTSFETTLLEPPSTTRGGVTLASLFNDTPEVIDKGLAQLRSSVVRAGWFTDNTQAQQHRSVWAASGGLVMLIGLAAAGTSFVAGFSTNPWPGLVGSALIVGSGVLLLSLARLRPTITDHGGRMRGKLHLYREWLASLEPHDIVPEQATDMFTSNIVSAVALGLGTPFATAVDTAMLRHRSWGGQLRVDTSWLDTAPASLVDRAKLLNRLLEHATRLGDRAGFTDASD